MTVLTATIGNANLHAAHFLRSRSFPAIGPADAAYDQPDAALGNASFRIGWPEACVTHSSQCLVIFASGRTINRPARTVTRFRGAAEGGWCKAGDRPLRCEARLGQDRKQSRQNYCH